jgi:hypothetical protein
MNPILAPSLIGDVITRPFNMLKRILRQADRDDISLIGPH